jgi:hypothetical protein
MRSVFKSPGTKISTPKNSSSALTPEQANQLIDDQASIIPVESTDLSSSDITAATEEANKIEKYGDSNLRSFGEGLARGAVPLSDVILTKAFNIDPEGIRERKRLNPEAAVSGEAAGLLGGAALTAGESLAAKATLGGAAVAAEEVGSKIIANALLSQSEKKLARKIVEKAVEKGIPAATTGSLLGVNTLLNESALGEADLTGENLVSYAGTGALLGAGVAGGLAAAGELARPLKIGLDNLTKQIKQRSSGITDLTDNFADLVSSSPARKTALKQQLEKMNVAEGEISDLARDLDWGISDSAKSRLSKFDSYKSKVSDTLDSLYKKADELAPNGVMFSDELGAKLNQAIDDYASTRKVQTTTPGFRSALRKARNEADAISRLGVEVKPVHMPDGTMAKDIVRSPDAVWNFSNLRERTRLFGKAAAESKTEFDRELNRLLNQKMREITQGAVDAVDQASDKSGLLNSLKENNRKYSLLRTIEDSGIQARADKHSDLLSLKDMVWGTAGVLHGGPAAAAGVILTKKALESDMRKMFVVLGTAQKVNEIYTKRVTDGLKNFFERSNNLRSKIQPAAKNALIASGLAQKGKNKPKNDLEAFNNLSQNIVAFKVNPDTLATKIAANTMRAGYAAPNSTKFAQISLARAINFLEEKMPKNMKEGVSLFKREYQPSNLELSKFKRYVQAIENPYSIIDELERGTLTREHIEAVSTVFPAVYERIRKDALAYSQNTPDLSYSKKVQLHILFNINTDPSLSAMSVAKLQSSFAQSAQPEQGAPGGAVKSTQSGLKNINVAERSETGMQKASKGIQE